MKIVRDIPNLVGKRVLVRVDFNVPVKDGVVTDDYRIRMALPTVDFLRERGAIVILASHLELPGAGAASLQPVVDCLRRLGREVMLVKDVASAHDIIGATSRRSDRVEQGGRTHDVILLENLRCVQGEKENSEQFARELASLADVYVNEAFPVSHREHASIVGVPRLLPSYAGFQFEKEVAHLSLVFNPPHPFTFLLNGAKFETKLPLLEKFLTIADTIFVGGALSSDFFRYKGYEVGRSLVSKSPIDLSLYVDNPKIILPTDVVDEEGTAWPVEGFPARGKIVDVGPQTIDTLGTIIRGSRCVLWNGPLGLYEDGYRAATLAIAQIVADATQSGTTSIVGGGDTIAAIETLGTAHNFTFISTGGGAMLEFLARETLPGIQALEGSPAIHS